MDTPTPSPEKESRRKHWLRGLRPLGLWVLFVLLLFAYRKHQELSENTHITFSVSLGGHPLSFGTQATIDGIEMIPGSRVRIGSHKFSLSNPKAETFSTNLFIWYGARDLGTINLVRKQATLTVEANPPASVITITGPEFSKSLTDSSGGTFSVPTDEYSVNAKFRYWEKREAVSVLPGLPQTVRFAPKFGTVELACDTVGTAFELIDTDGRRVEAGEFPAKISGLPHGTYTLTSKYRNRRREEKLSILEAQSTTVKVEFAYGALTFETDPPGANVIFVPTGQRLGVTPITISDVESGISNFRLEADGFEPVLGSIEVRRHETNTFRTNLVNSRYLGAVTTSRRELASLNFATAYEAAREALRIKPGDSVALSLSREALGFESIRLAEELAKRSDYAGALEKLKTAIESLPDNEKAKQLQVDYERRRKELVERQKTDKLNAARNAFATLIRQDQNADLFETRELKTSKPVAAVHAALLKALDSEPAFRVVMDSFPAKDTHAIFAQQDLMTSLSTVAGRRVCFIAMAETGDNETSILFKVIEYKSEAVNKFSIGALINAPVAVNFVVVHPSKVGPLTDKLQAQVREGISIVTARIERAIGE